ncbi:hypothetical protein ACFV7R_35395 [Streptomyces sp. NPDC059866]|uniref:hypothetical protein n=1 Tax=Streptomyces sp. NPDC059866 TaxID=3346978 RepID=UPI00365CEA89
MTPTRNRSSSSRYSDPGAAPLQPTHRGPALTITVEADFGPDTEGVLVAHGGQESGYLLYVQDGMLRYEQNWFGEMLRLDPIPVPSGPATVTIRVELPEPGTWLVGLEIDGKRMAQDAFPQFTGLMPFAGIDVDMDRRSPVSWELYTDKGPYPYSGRITKVTYTPGMRTTEALAELIEQAKELGLALE